MGRDENVGKEVWDSFYGTATGGGGGPRGVRGDITAEKGALTGREMRKHEEKGVRKESEKGRDSGKWKNREIIL